MQSEPQQIEVSPEMIVLGPTKEDSPDLEAALSRMESATHDISQKEAIPAINGNEAEQSDFVPKLIALPIIQEEDPINKPVVKVNQNIENEEPVQKEKKESDKIAGFERRDTADTATIEIPSSTAKPTESNNDNGISEGLRARFIRKVLLILLAQLVLTSLMVGMIFIPGTQYKKGIKNTPIIALVTVIVSILSLMILICNRKNLKRVPWNYILLFTFTSSASYSLTYLASYTESAVVLIAAVTLVLVIVGATIVAWNAKNSFSILVYVLSQLLPIALVVLVVGVAFSGYIVQAAISAGIALLFSAYLTYDIQRLIGNFEDKYTLDDYILAALDIYIDVYIIFVELLKLIQNVVQN